VSRHAHEGIGTASKAPEAGAGLVWTTIKLVMKRTRFIRVMRRMRIDSGTRLLTQSDFYRSPMESRSMCRNRSRSGMVHTASLYARHSVTATVAAKGVSTDAHARIRMSATAATATVTATAVTSSATATTAARVATATASAATPATRGTGRRQRRR
jgi:hypothetical protein